MSNICRYFDECMLREFEENPYSCDSRGNVRYEMWDCGEPTEMQYDRTCEMYQPMPDVGALEALADETEGAMRNENKATDLSARFAEVICTIAKEIRSVYGKYVHVVTDDEM